MKWKETHTQCKIEKARKRQRNRYKKREGDNNILISKGITECLTDLD